MKQNLLNEIFSKVKNVNILEKLNNPEVLLEYLELENKLKNTIDKKQILERKDELFLPTLGKEEKKRLIIQLANTDEVQAYQTLKKFSETAEEELQDFIKIALQESRALLQSTILGEPSILITSMLGGKDNKLRYFAMIFKNDMQEFTPWQKNIIEKEITFWLEQNDGESEEIKINKNFASLVFLFPYNHLPQIKIQELIRNINYFGNFLKEKFMIRNDKILSQEESQEIAEKIIKNSELNSENQIHISDLNLSQDNNPDTDINEDI